MFSGTRKWRLSALAIALAVTTAVAGGCGRSAGPSGSESPQTTLDDKPATGDLSIWAQADEAAALPKFADEFMKLNPGLKITVTPLPWDAAYNKYQTAIASGKTPDMAQMGTTWMSDFADAFAPAPTAFDMSKFFEGAVKPVTVKGTKLGVPWYVDTRVFYYRKDLAKKAGYTEFPKTWDKFMTFTKDLKTKAGAQWGVGLPVSGAGAFMGGPLLFGWSAGATLTNADQTQWTFDSPEWVKAMSYYQSLVKQGIVDPKPPTGAGAAESRFVNGSVPVWVAGPSGIGSLAKAGGGDSYKAKIAVGRVPADKTSTSFIGGSDLVAFKNSKNADAAWKFARWLTTSEVQVRWQQAVGDLPSVQAAWKDPGLKNDPLLKVFGEQLISTNTTPTIGTWTQVSDQADKTLEQIVRSGKDPAQAMKELQTKAQSIGTGS